MEGKAIHLGFDVDGNVKWSPSGKIACICVKDVRWLGFILIHGDRLERAVCILFGGVDTS